MNKKLYRTCRFLTLISLTLLLWPAQLKAQETYPLTPDQAISAAQAVIDDRVKRGLRPEWEDARATDPVLYYSPDLQPTVYALSAVKDGDIVGYLIVDRRTRPYPVLELAPLPPPHLRREADLRALDNYDTLMPDKFLYLGPLRYYRRLLPQNPKESIPETWLDLRTGRALLPSQILSSTSPLPSEQAIAPSVPSTTQLPTASKVLSGITDYDQFWGTTYGYSFDCYSGCTNAGAITLLSYWDTHGFPNLIGSNWRGDTDWIRTEAGGYCEGVWTWTNIGDIGPAIEAFAAHKGYDYFYAPLWYPSQSTYAAYCAEIDAGRPVLLHLIGYREGNHTVTGIGYNTNGNYMLIYDNYYDNDPIQYEVQYDETWMNQVAPDTLAPSTSRSLSGTSGDHGWYTSDVQITLAASDNSGGSGVDHIEYKINDGSWRMYSGPITISGEGHHTVYYKAQDKAGNWESQKQVSVAIDATAPTGSVALNAGASSTPGVLVHIESLATDATSGLYQLRVRNAGETWGAWQAYTGRLRWQLPAVTGQSHTVEVQIKDVAGNVSTTYADEILLDIYPERPASTGYRLARSTWGAAPKDGQSANYRLWGTAGQPSLIGDVRSTHYRLLSGYWSGQGRAGAMRRVYLPLVVRR